MSTTCYLFTVKEIVRYSHCFVCGEQNQIGLKVRFFWDGSQAQAQVTADELFEGYRGIYHGGIIATVLDEIMVKAILALGKTAVTAEMTIRYFHPVRTGDHLTFHGRVTKQRGPIYFAAADVVAPDGTTFATATGKYAEVRGGLKEELESSLTS